MINWRNIKLKTVVHIVLGLVVLFGMVKCVNHIVEIDEQNTAIRDANGGVLPGKEAIDNKDTRYTVRTILHNGNEYTCFTAGHRMGCAKE